MSCLKCKVPTRPSHLCSKHMYCEKCSSAVKKCQFCTLTSSCSSCPNKSLNSLCQISDCEHKLCSECLIKLSDANQCSCPICKNPFDMGKTKAFLQYFALKSVPSVKQNHFQCKHCGKKNIQSSQEYKNCQQCGFVQCSKHLNNMKICRCRCIDCFRQTKFDFYGKPIDCRCVTSETRIPQKSPSNFRPISSKQGIKSYAITQPLIQNSIKIINPISNYNSNNNIKVNAGLLTPVNQRQRSGKSKDIQNDKTNLRQSQNIILQIPNPYLYRQNFTQPQIPIKSTTPKKHPPLSPRPVTPLVSIQQPLPNPYSPRQSSTKSKGLTLNDNNLLDPSILFSPTPSSTRSMSSLPSQKSIQQSKSIPKDQYNEKYQNKRTPTYEKWKCKKCLSILDCKKRRSGLCTFCSLSATFMLKI